MASLCWLATEQGIDLPGTTAAQVNSFLHLLFTTQGLALQTIKGYRYWLASVLSWAANGAVVHDRIISNMLCSMHLERPRLPGFSLRSPRMGSWRVPYRPCLMPLMNPSA